MISLTCGHNHVFLYVAGWELKMGKEKFYIPFERELYPIKSMIKADKKFNSYLVTLKPSRPQRKGLHIF